MSKYFIISLLLISKCVVPIDGFIRVCNKGGYLAKCYLQSRAADSARRNHHDDTGLFPVAQCRTMEIPVIAVLNRFECKSLAFIAVYKSIFVQEFASSIFNYCYEITGTALNPKWSQTRC
ncbi:unnamed protein product [Rotaria magnacalcarata]|uniref:Uncharacterized protein n=1 Tax=Rotaria magnacalcarata TaxID=392030 RepID=A0A819JJ04_9BILA|nr:unnamed protein product [Rotaria magnacalcarata]CAF2172133.1 unnamed protein product [Rotaria magnacalcarata]CAF3881563.1 unnamed protein product [Rotaria magnacalcarata]CAF3934733.1 unnamed protein product [Rotaria magnacalcarata]